MTEQQGELTEQFVYPVNKTLKKAYLAVIRAVLDQRRVIFQPVTLIGEILDYLELPDDANYQIIDNKTGRQVPPGTHFRRAKGLLKALEGKFTRFRGSSLEVIVYRLDGVRVKSFSELEQLCAVDVYMSEVVATAKRLNSDQPWEDALIQNSTYPVSNELSAIDDGIKQAQKNISEACGKTDERRHCGIVKGAALKTRPYNVPGTLDEDPLNTVEPVGSDDAKV